MDVSSRDHQRIEDLISNKHLRKNRLFTFASFVAAKEADIEDLFEEADYVEIVETCYASQIKGQKIDISATKHLRIIERIKCGFKSIGLDHSGFSHYCPAKELMKNIKLQKKVYSKTVLDRFETIFKTIIEFMK
jgi:hypothetical protein